MSEQTPVPPSLASSASRYQTIVSTVVVPPNTWTQLCDDDPRRWGLRLQAVSSAASGAVYAPVSNLGSLSAPPGGSSIFEIKFRDYPAQCGSAWFGFLTTGFTALVTEEIFLG